MRAQFHAIPFIFLLNFELLTVNLLGTGKKKKKEFLRGSKKSTIEEKVKYAITMRTGNSALYFYFILPKLQNYKWLTSKPGIYFLLPSTIL